MYPIKSLGERMRQLMLDFDGKFPSYNEFVAKWTEPNKEQETSRTETLEQETFRKLRSGEWTAKKVSK